MAWFLLTGGIFAKKKVRKIQFLVITHKIANGSNSQSMNIKEMIVPKLSWLNFLIKSKDIFWLLENLCWIFSLLSIQVCSLKVVFQCLCPKLG